MIEKGDVIVVHVKEGPELKIVGKLVDIGEWGVVLQYTETVWALVPWESIVLIEGRHDTSK